MAIILRLDRVMADRKMSLNELSEKVGVANVNLSKLKSAMSAPFGFLPWRPSVKPSTASRETFWSTRRILRSKKPDL